MIEEIEALIRKIVDDKASNETDVAHLERSRMMYLACLVKINTGTLRESWLEQLVDLLDRQYERYSAGFEHPNIMARLGSMISFQNFSNRIFDLDEETVEAHPKLRRYAEIHRNNKFREKGLVRDAVKKKQATAKK